MQSGIITDILKKYEENDPYSYKESFPCLIANDLSKRSKMGADTTSVNILIMI